LTGLPSQKSGNAVKVESKPQKAKLSFSEILNFAYDTFRTNKLRVSLTALGMSIGTASLVLVVAIGMTGKQYLLGLIQSIGSNEIWAEYQSGQSINGSASDFLTIDDMRAVQNQVPGILAATPIVSLSERIPFGPARERDVHILGAYPSYMVIRNLVVVSGRFFDAQDEQQHNKVVVVTQTMAKEVYGSASLAIGHVIKLSGLPFTVIGTFRERVDTLGQTEVTDYTIVIPYSVSTYFDNSGNLKMMYFSVADASSVIPATMQIKNILQSRHRAESNYNVQNLSQLVDLANKTAVALTIMLLAITTVVLVVSGIGIMNIMLATVTARTREVGIRRALGATGREVCLQFLSEAILISIGGGIVGVLFGLAIPFSVRFFTQYRIPISGLSAIIAIVVSSLIGILFGTVPAVNAAKLEPVESLRHE
jgi:putative ABC transport system permease protein